MRDLRLGRLLGRRSRLVFIRRPHRPRPSLGRCRERLSSPASGTGPVSCFNSSSRLRPRTGLDQLLEAQLGIAQGHFANAFSALAQISDSHPIAPQAHLMAGRLYRQLSCLRKAEASFRQALKLKPSLIEAHKELIYILGIQSRRREVDAEFHELARLTQLTHHDLFTWALTHFTEWNPDIVDDLDGFIRADPDDRYSRLAVVELLLERPAVASYIEKILAPLPRADPDVVCATNQPGSESGKD